MGLCRFRGALGDDTHQKLIYSNGETCSPPANEALRLRRGDSTIRPATIGKEKRDYANYEWNAGGVDTARSGERAPFIF